jgi:glucose-6-phosphate-specific signal transduction histidine kinase/DNA-binding CsgD family transcriptional regulator
MLDVLDSPTTRFVQETERRRIARELHDGVVQSLTALVSDLEYFRTRCLPTIDQAGREVAEKVATWQELASDSLTSMRHALGELRSPVGSDPSLEQAIQIMLNELRMDGYGVVFECEEWPARLSPEYTSNIYYIMREALANIRKHAQASSIKICMFCFEKHLHVSIGDDGVGIANIDAAANAKSGYNQGLVGMRERATYLNGRLTIESAHSRGTRVDVDIPYSLEEQSTENGQCKHSLTARELEVLVLIARGMLAKEISRTLAVSEKTVRNHISSIYHKLNIFDRSQLVIYAMRNGLIDIYDGLYE